MASFPRHRKRTRIAGRVALAVALGIAACDAGPVAGEEPKLGVITPEGPASTVADFFRVTEPFADVWTAVENNDEANIRFEGRLHFDIWDVGSASPGIGAFENPDPTDPDFLRIPSGDAIARRVWLTTVVDLTESTFFRAESNFTDARQPGLKDFFLGSVDLPGNQTLRIGHQKRPLGLEYINSSLHNVFLERALAVEAFNENVRRVGVGVLGHSDDESVTWRYGIFNETPLSLVGDYDDGDIQPTYNLRIATSPVYESDGRVYLHLGVAGMVGDPEDGTTFFTPPEASSVGTWLDTGAIAGAETFETLGLEAMLNLGALQLCGEYQFNWTQRDRFSPAGDFQPDVRFHGGYAYVSYFLTGEHIPYERTLGRIGRPQPRRPVRFAERLGLGKSDDDTFAGHGWGAWQVAARVSTLDLTDGDIRGGRGVNTSLALNWYLTAFAKLQLNVVRSEIEDRGPIAGFSQGSATLTGLRFALEF